MMHDSSKSGYPMLPAPQMNGNHHLPAPALSGHVVGVEPEAALGGAAAEGGGSSFVQALGRCWLPALFLGLLSGAAVGAATWYLWPTKYTAQALVHVPPRPGTYGEDLQQHIRTQSALLKSRRVLEPALRRAEVTRLSLIQDEIDPVSMVEKNLQVDSNLGPEVLRLTLNGDRPDELPVIVNAIVAVFVEEASQTEQSNYETKTKQLKAKEAEYKKLLREQRATLLGLEEQHGPEALQTPLQRRDAFLSQIAAVEKELLQSRVDLKANQRELEAFQSKDPTEGMTGVSEAAVEDFLRQDPRYQELQKEMFKLDQDAARVRDVATEQALREQQDRLASRRSLLAKALEDRRTEVRPIAERVARSRTVDTARDNRVRLEARQAGLEERVRQLEAQLDQLKTTAREPGRRVAELDTVRDAVTSLESGLKRVTEQLDALKIDAPLATRVNVLDKATPPKSKNTDRQTKMAGLAGLGAFGLLFAGIVWRELRTQRVYATHDVVQRLGGTLLGTLPVLPRKARQAAPASTRDREDYWQERLGESVDAIRTQLLRAARGDGLKIVMVTSAVGGEGKTSLATHLAVSLARAWRKTLLIDGDLRKPAVHVQFEQALEPGFCDVLRGELDFSDVIRPTPVSRLWVVPAGQWDTHALQALAQETVEKLLGPLKEQYDFIIIDSSPVLPVADTLSLGQHADGVILSVLRNVSRLPAIQAAQQRLASVGIHLLGTVVVGATEELANLGYNLAARPKVTNTAS